MVEQRPISFAEFSRFREEKGLERRGGGFQYKRRKQPQSVSLCTYSVVSTSAMSRSEMDQ